MFTKFRSVPNSAESRLPATTKATGLNIRKMESREIRLFLHPKQNFADIYFTCI